VPVLLLLALVLLRPAAAEAQALGSSGTAKTAPAWYFCQVHPWVVATEQQLASAPPRRIASLRVRGAREDWITAAFMIRTDSEKATVSFTGVEGPAPVRERLQVRIAGMGNYRGGGFTPDPLFLATDLRGDKELGRYLSNWECIKDFPRLLVTPEHPALLWLTLRTHGLRAGPYTARLKFADAAGHLRSVEVRAYVYPPQLPEQSPLYYFLWQYVPGEPVGRTWVREYVEHGVNVFHQQHELAWSGGARFLLFFAPGDAFGRKLPITPKRRQQVLEGTRKILATVRKLKLGTDQWAIYITDEPKDEDMGAVIEYARLMREVAAGIPFYVTLPWGPAPRNTWCTPAGVRKLAATGLISVWHPYWYHAWDGAGTWEVMKRTGRPIWIYSIQADVPRTPNCGLSMYRLGPWYAFKYGVAGYGVYAGYSFNGDPWNDLDRKHDYYVNYSFGPRGFVTTRAFEALRQGVQEYKLLDELVRRGADPQWLGRQVEEATHARRPQTLEALRRRLLWRLTSLER